MRRELAVAALLLALVSLGCRPGTTVAGSAASPSDASVPAHARSPEHSPSAQATATEVDTSFSQPPAKHDQPCEGTGSGVSVGVAALPRGDAVVEAILNRAEPTGCGDWMLTLQDLTVAWKIDDIMYPDDVKNPVPVPDLPTSFKVRTIWGQEIGRLETPTPVVVWLTYDDLQGWRAEYVLQGDTLRPVRARPDSMLANNHLRLLYHEDEDTRAERIAAQVERLQELQATQRANATNRERPPTPRLDYLDSRTDD